MAKKLTAGVLQGKAYKEKFNFDWNNEEFEIEIRPLDNKEAMDIEELTQEGITIKGKPGLNGKMTRQMDFDTKKNLRGRRQSDILAVALGSTDESITKEVVELEFPAEVVTKIADRIKQISGINSKESAEELVEDEESGK